MKTAIISFKKGDLVYLPSDTKILQLDKDGSPVRYHKTDKPHNVLIIGETHLGRFGWPILLDGERWLCSQTNLFPISEVSHG